MIQMSSPSEAQLTSAHTPQAHAGPSQTVGVGATPHPSIGSSMNYVQGLQNESRTQTFQQGASEGKTPGGTGLSGIANKAKGIFSNGSGEAEGAGDSAAEGAAESAGEGLVEDAAVVAL